MKFFLQEDTMIFFNNIGQHMFVSCESIAHRTSPSHCLVRNLNISGTFTPGGLATDWPHQQTSLEGHLLGVVGVGWKLLRRANDEGGLPVAPLRTNMSYDTPYPLLPNVAVFIFWGSKLQLSGPWAPWFHDLLRRRKGPYHGWLGQTWQGDTDELLGICSGQSLRGRTGSSNLLIFRPWSFLWSYPSWESQCPHYPSNPWCFQAPPAATAAPPLRSRRPRRRRRPRRPPRRRPRGRPWLPRSWRMTRFCKPFRRTAGRRRVVSKI